MSKVIEELKRIEIEIEVNERVSPIANVKLYGLYETAEYKRYIDKVVELISLDKSLDMYTWFLSLNSEILVNFDDKVLVGSILEAYGDYLRSSFEKLSPSSAKQRESFIEKGINSFFSFIEINLLELYKTENEEKRLLEVGFLLQLEDFIAVFDELNFKYDNKLKKNVITIIGKFKHLNEEQLASQAKEQTKEETKEKPRDKPSENKLESTLSSKEDKSSYSSINYQSYKWQILLDKIEVLKKLVDSDRLFETAIVYEDIQNILVKFDPKEYFPEVFFPLYKKVAPEVKKIQQSIDNYSYSTQWKIAQKMYQIDYRSFLEDCEKMPENNIVNSENAKDHFYESRQDTLSDKKPNYGNSMFEDEVVNDDSQEDGNMPETAHKKDGDDDDIFDF